MIIQITGTSGSGKSTVVRHLKSQLTDVSPVYIEGRRAPIGYRGHLAGADRPIFITGHYEAPTGGCDTIKDGVLVMDTVRRQHDRGGNHVVFEGLFVMNHTRGPALARQVGAGRMAIIHLSVPLPECVERINTRRAVQGRGPLKNHHYTERNYIRARNYVRKMQAQGVEVRSCTTDRAQTMLLEMLRCPSQ